MELSADLQVKEREVRFLKIKTLFESPTQKKDKKGLQNISGDQNIDDADTKRGELQIAKSARVYGRSRSRGETDFGIDHSGIVRNSNIVKNENSELLKDHFNEDDEFA